MKELQRVHELINPTEPSIIPITEDERKKAQAARSKVFTLINYSISGIAWLLALLTLLFNICGLWAPWHLAGFGFIFYVPITILPQILSMVFSHIAKNKKHIVLNAISIFITVFTVPFTICVSADWFW